MPKLPDESPAGPAAPSAAAEASRSTDTTDPGPPPTMNADTPVFQQDERNRSIEEPVDVIFRKIAQREQIVPRSVERGESYQAVNAPAPRHEVPVEPPVVLNVTTDPGGRRAEVTTTREDAPPVAARRRRLQVAVGVLVAGVGLVVAMALALVPRSDDRRTGAPSSTSATQPTATQARTVQTPVPPPTSVPMPSAAPAAITAASVPPALSATTPRAAPPAPQTQPTPRPKQRAPNPSPGVVSDDPL